MDIIRSRKYFNKVPAADVISVEAAEGAVSGDKIDDPFFGVDNGLVDGGRKFF